MAARYPPGSPCRVCIPEAYSGIETAAILGIRVGTVKSRLHRARGRLKKFLTAGTF